MKNYTETEYKEDQLFSDYLGDDQSIQEALDEIDGVIYAARLDSTPLGIEYTEQAMSKVKDALTARMVE